MMLFLLGAMLQAAPLPPETWKERNRPDMPAISACELGAGSRIAATITQLPDEVAAELHRFFGPEGGISEANGLYNSTDVVNGGVPVRRFLRAHQVGDYWIVWYERGGLAAGQRTIALKRDGNREGSTYRMLPGTTFRGDLCAATKAIAAGVRSGNA